MTVLGLMVDVEDACVGRQEKSPWTRVAHHDNERDPQDTLGYILSAPRRKAVLVRCYKFRRSLCLIFFHASPADLHLQLAQSRSQSPPQSASRSSEIVSFSFFSIAVMIRLRMLVHSVERTISHLSFESQLRARRSMLIGCSHQRDRYGPSELFPTCEDGFDLAPRCRVHQGPLLLDLYFAPPAGPS
jgi:hypothetical protein